MTTLHVFIGDATHEDSRDGIQPILILSDDIPSELKKEAMEDYDDDTLLVVLSRVDMDSLNKSIEEKWDTHGVDDGYLVDLTEPYILGFEQ